MFARALVFLALGLLATACSRPDSVELSPITAPSGSLTLTITAAGVSPKRVTVNAGSQVTFVNNDLVVHEMYSDPHPAHTECPELNQVGHLSPGQVKQTGNLNTTRTCGFHDHERPLNASLQGDIEIR